MSKVYLSFLGTNDYVDCIYKTNGSETNHPVRFVQETTLGLFADKASASDRAYIFLTDEARIKNWQDNGHWDRQNKCTKTCQGLKARIARMNLAFPVHDISIPEGYDEAQIWEIFNTVYDVLKNGDEVYFDITHAFRSIPMLAVVILNYARVLKRTRLQSILYGAFEVLGPAYKVKDMPMAQRLAPLIDLTPLATLSEWTTAVDRFVGAGDAGGVADLARKAALPIMSKTKGVDETANAVKGIADALGYFSRQLSTCRGPDICHAAEFVKTELKKNQNVDLVKPLVPLLRHVEKQTSKFNGERVSDGIQAAKWCLDHGMIQQGFTILQETLISYVIISCGEDEFDKNQREIVSSLTGVLQKRLPRTKWEGCLVKGENQCYVAQYESFYGNNNAIIDMWQKLTESRNDMNHAGYTKQKLSDKVFEPRLRESISVAEALVGASFPWTNA